MKLLKCPLNGARNISEFICGGEVRPSPDAASGDGAWTDHLYPGESPAGPVREWWFHVPSSYWFIAERDTATGEILRTYPPEDLEET